MTNAEIEQACQHAVRLWESILEGERPFPQTHNQFTAYAAYAVQQFTRIELALQLRDIAQRPYKDLW